jgi:acyl-coenzyme A thioesterase PaaI-like protein
MFLLADVAIWVAIIGKLGAYAVGSVTTNLNINFLRKPEPGDLIAETRLFKVGKRLAIGEALIYAEGGGEPVAHATATYSIPPK